MSENDDIVVGDVLIRPDGIPRCANHGCDLEGVPFPMPDKGTARCPVSGAMFEYSAKVDPDVVVQLKDGTVTKMPFWEVQGSEEQK